MRRAAIDQTIQRVEMEGFPFPLGVYPLQPMTPARGYTEQFEQADGGESPGSYLGSGGFDDWEEWPDRFVYDILVASNRVRSLFRALVAMLPGRVFPILDVLGSDAYREIDPHLAYELIGIERFYDGIREWDDWLFEDGLVGFGAMSVEPFFYVFLDEHKIVTVRAELSFKERVEKLLAAFDLTVVEELKGVDSTEHEHRGVLVATSEESQMISADEIIERLRDAWGLQLNIDSSTNVDDEGTELGVTGWQCIVRCAAEPAPSESESGDEADADATKGAKAKPAAESAAEADAKPEIIAYAEVLLSADNLETAEKLAIEATRSLSGAPADGWSGGEDVIKADRVLPEQLAEWLTAGGSAAESGKKPKPKAPAKKAADTDSTILVHEARWLVEPPEAAPKEARRKRLPKDRGA